MATAVMYIEALPPPPLPKTTVTLTMSLGEATFLVQLLRKIGGDPVQSRRKYANAISEALRIGGVEAPWNLKDLMGDISCLSTS